ncbi:class E sortase [Streptomyces sp. P9(2023)]|uniref:class E sortase n=1 Tax=Streptomyces sp. P9(2023) TaxID=3064394 RepID=UPI0028F4550C|nr:class E sortase [Streptomyces sp. P9(2023)]MDT9689242.1 class E sortase [Streptomyces sp. P9(2023)]
MRDRVRERVPVVVQTCGVRSTPARVLWVCAEAVVTCGVVLMLLVVHQLWWTNQQARAQAGEQVRVLEREWEGERESELEWGGSPEVAPEVEPAPEATPEATPEPVPVPVPAPDTASPPPSSLAYAIIRIPRIGLTAPIARGVGKRSVLDRGYVGHYPNTAAPGQTGNFALAGHRNTHGEPFRYINRLQKGDRIRVQTRDASYEYVVDQVLAQTAPRDTGVIQPVPRSLVKPSYGYSRPGAYLTLTTCTPEFSSTYRLIVWAKRV